MAASFYSSPLIGATTTLACFAHEIPHEIADYSILIRAGFTKRQAMQSQFLTAVGAFVRTLFCRPRADADGLCRWGRSWASRCTTSPRRMRRSRRRISRLQSGSPPRAFSARPFSLRTWSASSLSRPIAQLTLSPRSSRSSLVVSYTLVSTLPHGEFSSLMPCVQVLLPCCPRKQKAACFWQVLRASLVCWRRARAAPKLFER
jgi:hypothetical protein